jgi:probable F420-dependent oxidoreductase
MQIGVNLPIFGEDAKAVVETARLAESLGFESVWVGDHLVTPLEVSSSYPYNESGDFTKFRGFLDPFVGMTAVAMKTEKLRIGMSVLIVPYRNPVVTAKLIASVDIFSEGQIDIGVGSGWLAEEFEALDVPFGRRGARTDEYLTLYRKLWNEDVVTFDGEFYKLKAVRFDPKPYQRPGPPIWIGGNTRAAMRRLARFGDVWQPINMSAAQLAAARPVLDEICERDGRDPSTVRLAVNRGVRIIDDASKIRPPDPNWPYQMLTGTAEQIIEEFRAYRDLGVHQVHCHFAARDQEGRHNLMRRFAAELRPEVER